MKRQSMTNEVYSVIIKAVFSVTGTTKAKDLLKYSFWPSRQSSIFLLITGMKRRKCTIIMKRKTSNYISYVHKNDVKWMITYLVFGVLDQHNKTLTKWAYTTNIAWQLSAICKIRIKKSKFLDLLNMDKEKITS